MKKHILIFVLTGISCLLSQFALSQISEGGNPVSFSLGIDTRDLPVIVMPCIDVEKLLSEDAKTQNENIQKPFRFGYAIDVDIDIKKDGRLELLANGDKIWLLKIHSANAFSINLIYSQFHLSQGSKFFVYSEDETIILGAFTPGVSNNPYNEYATDLILGNTIILEYYEPESSNDGVIVVNKVIHGYVDILRNRSASCHSDANCTPGKSWDNEKRAVALIIMEGSVCTGCLINNTRQDLTPYFLTAAHCYFDENGKPLKDINPATSVFRFGYLKPNCDSCSAPDWKSITGATVCAHDYWTDFALLELKTKPPANYNVFYAGWSRFFNETGGTSIGLHHPAGDVMKISVGWNGDIISWWGGQTKTHWQVNFGIGTVQGGSSGSPLFQDSNHRIVGQLSGDHKAPCKKDDDECFCILENRVGEYGRFDLSWEGNKTNATRLKNWLDPDKTDVYYLDGINGINGTNCENNLTNQTITSNQTIVGCDILNIKDVNITNSAIVAITANEEVIIKPGFCATTGTNVSISIISSAPSFSPPQPSMVMKNNETWEHLEEAESKEVGINNKLEIKLYPNPNSGTFQIDANFPLSDIANLKITNSLGATVYKTQNLSSNTIQLPASASGLHFVVVMLKDGSVLTEKMMIQR